MAEIVLPDPEVNTEILSFVFDDGVVNFGTLRTGDQIIESEIIIETVFDDGLLTLGLETNPGGIFATNQVNAQRLGTYHNGEGILITADTDLRLQILSGTATQGTGRVVVLIRRI